MPYYKKKSEAPVKKRVYKKKPVKQQVSHDVVPKKGGPFSKIGTALGGIGGSYFGPAGTIIGSKLGNYLGGKIGSVFGSGDYIMPNFKVGYNTLSDGTSPPQFTSGKRITKVCHREYIKDIFSGPTLVSGATAFNIETFSINPGLEQTFPWLTSVAANYECYRIDGMIFEFKSMSSNALTSTNTALGTVIMATQYNAASTDFVNKQQMENYEFAQSCKPAESMLHMIECARNETPIPELYVRLGAVPSNQDQRLYDIGDFSIATQGMQAENINLGELWVTYDITLFKPKLVQGGIGFEINYAHLLLDESSTGANPLIPKSVGVNDTMRLTITSNSIITFPSTVLDGQYFLSYSCNGASTLLVNAPTITATSNCTLNSSFLNQTAQSFRNPGAAVTASRVNVLAVIDITGPSAVVTFGTAGVLPTALTGVDLFVTQIPNNVF